MFEQRAKWIPRLVMENKDLKKRKRKRRGGGVDVVFQTHFNKKTSNALWEFAVVASLRFLEANRQLVKIVSVCFLTMGYILCREVVSAFAQSVDMPLGTYGCAFQQVGLIQKRKTGTFFNLKLIWQKIEMVLVKSAFDPRARVF